MNNDIIKNINIIKNSQKKQITKTRGGAAGLQPIGTSRHWPTVLLILIFELNATPLVSHPCLHFFEDILLANCGMYKFDFCSMDAIFLATGIKFVSSFFAK